MHGSCNRQGRAIVLELMGQHATCAASILLLLGRGNNIQSHCIMYLEIIVSDINNFFNNQYNIFVNSGCIIYKYIIAPISGVTMLMSLKKTFSHLRGRGSSVEP